jgi:RimJ/RimL family protein N-acetyltransferase
MIAPPEPEHIEAGSNSGFRMIDARHYSVQETLRNGVTVQIRSLHPDDGERMDAAFKKLEQESIRLRFFGAKAGLTEQEHRLIREWDFDSSVALVVTLTERDEEVIIASGSYTRMSKDAAEVAFIVEEDHHGQGVAHHLLRHLGLIARERGIVRFEAEVLPQNRAMRRVFASSGWPMTSQRVDDVIHITLELASAIQ